MSTLLKLSRVEAGAVSGDPYRVIKSEGRTRSPGIFFGAFREEVQNYSKLSHLQNGDRFNMIYYIVGFEQIVDVAWWHGHGQLSPLLQHCCHVAQALCELPAGSGSQC